MNNDYDYLREQAKTEMHIKKLVNGGWLVSVNPRNGDVPAPFMAFSTAEDLLAELSLLTGETIIPDSLAKMSNEEFHNLFCAQRLDNMVSFGNGQTAMQNDISSLVTGKKPGEA